MFTLKMSKLQRAGWKTRSPVGKKQRDRSAIVAHSTTSLVSAGISTSCVPIWNECSNEAEGAKCRGVGSSQSPALGETPRKDLRKTDLWEVLSLHMLLDTGILGSEVDLRLYGIYLWVRMRWIRPVPRVPCSRASRRRSLSSISPCLKPGA
jgi:hypothetical protein